MPSTITCRHVITLVSVGAYFLSDSQSSTNRKKIHLLLKPYIHSLTEYPLHLGCHTVADYYLIQFYTTYSNKEGRVSQLLLTNPRNANDQNKKDTAPTVAKLTSTSRWNAPHSHLLPFQTSTSHAF